MADYGGWTGKTLRIDLSSGAISTEDTIAKYKDYLGGSGMGFKVLWDEVPAGTKAWDPENRLVISGGPLTGTGAPCTGRTTITSLFPPNAMELPETSHMGGYWGAELKFAGWDGIIVQGKASSPVWVYINNDKVEIRDASRLWGQGIFRTTTEICAEMGSDAHVAAIGQAGENLCRMSTIQCDKSHSAGGHGSVMGSKNLKAIGVKGNGAVKIAADKGSWKSLVNETLTLLGCNNQGVVPRSPQPWAEYSGGTRWWAGPGRPWGAADPPMDTGICSAEDLNKIGIRTHKGIQDHGMNMGSRYTVRMVGCHACPIRCHPAMEVPQLEQYGVSRYQTNSCIGNSNGRMIYDGVYSFPADSEARLITSQLGVALFDDYGLWFGYISALRTLGNAYKWGIIEANLSADEYKSIPWDLLETGDPKWILDVVPRVVNKKGEFGQAFADGPGWLEKRWPEMADRNQHEYALKTWKMGHSYHHSVENGGNMAALIQLMGNRDPQCHTHTNFFGNGLPLEIKKELGTEIFGTPDAVEAYHQHKPMNQGKAKFAKLSWVYKQLHDSMTMCNYTLPIWASPLKSRNYRGDPDMEAKFYSAVTGDTMNREELEDAGVRISSLFRALTARHMNEKDQRNKHDLIPAWAFEHGEPAFTPGSDRLDHDDMELGKDMLYEEFGWDKTTGMPTQATLDRLGMDDIEL